MVRQVFSGVKDARKSVHIADASASANIQAKGRAHLGEIDWAHMSRCW